MTRKLSTVGMFVLSLFAVAALPTHSAHAIHDEVLVMGDVVPSDWAKLPKFIPMSQTETVTVTELHLEESSVSCEDEATPLADAPLSYVSNESIASENLVEHEVIVEEEIFYGDEVIEAINENPHFNIGELCDLPDLPTRVKACTDYHCYNLPNTPHWRLQQCAWTDVWGLRRFNDDYIVGLGTYYSTNIGDRFEVTLDTGRVFTVILGDNKADCDTDEANMYKPCSYYNPEDANVLEFIADFSSMPDWVFACGTIDCIDEFAGNIIQMKYIGRDNSADWDSYI